MMDCYCYIISSFQSAPSPFIINSLAVPETFSTAQEKRGWQEKVLSVHERFRQSLITLLLFEDRSLKRAESPHAAPYMEIAELVNIARSA
jgi:hypothetical protein